MSNETSSGDPHPAAGKPKPRDSQPCAWRNAVHCASICTEASTAFPKQFPDLCSSPPFMSMASSRTQQETVHVTTETEVFYDASTNGVPVATSYWAIHKAPGGEPGVILTVTQVNLI